MNLVFIHAAEKVKQDTLGNLYTDGSYSMGVWNRYLKVADHITLVMRKDDKIYDSEEAKRKFNMIDQDKLSFVEIPNQSASVKTYFDPAIKKRVKKILFDEVEKSDAVIVRIPGTEKVIDYAKKLNKPYLVEVVGCPFDALWNHGLRGKVLATPAWYRLKKAMKKVDHAVYVTNEFLQERYPTPGESISCSDVSVIHPGENQLEAYTEWEKETGPIVLGTAAGIDVRYKGQQYVIRALKRLKQQGMDNFVYQIAGNGDPAYLMSEAKKNDVEDMVQFVGSIPHDQMSAWYRNLDIYIQPSKQEGLPRAVIEAMCNGVACIGSRTGGIPELLDEESIFGKGDVKTLAKLLKKFCDPQVRKEKGRKNFLKSVQYDKRILEDRRVAFMKKVFLKGANNNEQ